MSSPEISVKSLRPALAKMFHLLRRYSSVLIFLLFTGVYGYVILQINSLSNPAVDTSEVLSEAKALPVPKIDEESAQKLQSLEDNSVNVQTLFEQGRTDPFQ